jgi:hypothetical protein
MEVIIANAMMVVVAMVIAFAWAGVGRPAVDAITCCRILQEMDLAAAFLARDFGGTLADPSPQNPGWSGPKTQYRLLGWVPPLGAKLQLSYDGGTVITYSVDGSTNPPRLLRENQNQSQGADTTFCVARYVQAMSVSQTADGWLQVQLTFTNRTVTRTSVLAASVPLADSQ